MSNSSEVMPGSHRIIRRLARPVPRFDLTTEPQACPTPTGLVDRLRHVGVTPLVLVNRVWLREAKHGRDVVRIDQVVDVNHASHPSTLGDATDARDSPLPHSG